MHPTIVTPILVLDCGASHGQLCVGNCLLDLARLERSGEGVSLLPSLQAPEQVDVLDDLAIDSLRLWDQLASPAREHLVALAVTNLACARQSWQPGLLLNTLHTAARALRLRSKERNSPEDLDFSVRLYQEELGYAPDGPLRALCLSNLAREDAMDEHVFLPCLMDWSYCRSATRPAGR